MDVTADELNRRFSADGRIVFREGPGGDPIAVLLAPQGVCEVSVYGGHLLSYRAKGFQDTLWMSPLAEFVQGKAIRGGIPVCWPWFGKPFDGMPEGTYTHGFARRSLWSVAATEYSSSETVLVLELTEATATHPAWPYRYHLQLTVTLGDCLTLDLQTRNLDNRPFTYSECFHAYLRVADIRKVGVYGVEDGPIAFSDDIPHDRIYPKADILAAVKDPVMDRAIGIAADDTGAVVVWNPSLKHSMGDVPLDGSRHFVCVEPANPHQVDAAVTLDPGEAHTMTLRLQPTVLKH